VLLVDSASVWLSRRLPAGSGSASDRVLDVITAGTDGPVRAVRRTGREASPRISVVIATYERLGLLAGCLEGFAGQTIDPSLFEVVVVDDGSADPRTASVLARFSERLPLVWALITHAGRSAAKNVGVLLARGDIVVIFDDDDRPAPDLLAEHLRAHEQRPAESEAILGHTDWAPELRVTPLMRYLTDVDKLLFSYGNLTDGDVLDWRGFWEGRVSCKRSLLVRHGLHDQRLEYSVDVELALRLAPHGLKVTYWAAARSHMARPVTFDDFCARSEAKGRALATIASLHPEEEGVRRYTRADEAPQRWERTRAALEERGARVRELEGELAESGDDRRRDELYRLYREVFTAYTVKGTAEALPHLRGRHSTGEDHPRRRLAPTPPSNARAGMTFGAAPEPDAGSPGPPRQSPPALTVTIPVWNTTPELADMTMRTVDRLWEVARIPTEVVVIDNGSPHKRPLRAHVYRFAENQGVAVAWNAGIRRASAPVVAVLNSDCLVEPGWDEALYEAVATGRRIAFPYTDHGDGLGFRQPDQGGTAGWCFMLTLDTYREVGPFDERFSPAFCEDTDYWHRAWELGIELTPVPAARVSHARRTTTGRDANGEWLLLSHRYLYGWKHGVEPLRAPPYYNREIVEYHCRGLVGGRR
jgi:glycosyltransferase involved in cell wall biosynthesis